MTVTDHTTALLGADQLLRTAELFARDRDLLRHLQPTSTERSWHRLESTDRLEVWLIGWPSGTGTGWHDHAGSHGAFHTVTGSLVESTWAGSAPRSTRLAAGEGRSFGSHHVHDVVNVGDTFAVSIHAYAPALRGMTRYRVQGDRLVAEGLERAGRW